MNLLYFLIYVGTKFLATSINFLLSLSFALPSFYFLCLPYISLFALPPSSHPFQSVSHTYDCGSIQKSLVGIQNSNCICSDINDSPENLPELTKLSRKNIIEWAVASTCNCYTNILTEWRSSGCASSTCVQMDNGVYALLQWTKSSKISSDVTSKILKIFNSGHDPSNLLKSCSLVDNVLNLNVTLQVKVIIDLARLHVSGERERKLTLITCPMHWLTLLFLECLAIACTVALSIFDSTFSRNILMLKGWLEF